jgi:hypothetical protein
VPKSFLPVGALLAGMAVGWWAALRAQPPARTEIAALTARIERADQEVARLAAEAARMRAELQGSSGRGSAPVARTARLADPPTEAPTPGPPGPVRLRDLQAAGAIPRAWESMAGREPRLTGLTKPERERVLGVAADVRARMEGIERARMVQTNTVEGATVYRIPAFPDEGAALRRDLSDRVLSILGPERAPEVVEALEASFGWGEFGSRDRIITVSVDDSGGSPAYQVREESGGNASRSIRSSSSGGDVPEQYRHLFRTADAPP